MDCNANSCACRPPVVVVNRPPPAEAPTKSSTPLSKQGITSINTQPDKCDKLDCSLHLEPRTIWCIAFLGRLHFLTSSTWFSTTRYKTNHEPKCYQSIPVKYHQCAQYDEIKKLLVHTNHISITMSHSGGFSIVYFALLEILLWS